MLPTSLNKMQECPKCNSKTIKIDRTYTHWNIYECVNCRYWTYQESEQCCKNPYEIITIDHKSNGNIALYYQCTNCGGSSNRTKPLSRKKYGEQIRSEFSNSMFEKYHENKRSEGKILAERKSWYNKTNSRRYKYQKYLTSEKWKNIREKVKERDNFLCQQCKLKKAEEVHHLNYENVFNEKMEDLISVCSECHMELHNNEEKTSG